MDGIQRRRGRAIAATAMAALLLVGLAGCGGGSSDAGSDGSTKTTKAGSSDSGSDSGGSGDSTEAKGLPDPCSLVPIEKASEILGGESAEPDGSTNEVGAPLRACTWKTQASVDNPTLDGAGHFLTLSVIGPIGDMTIDEFYDAAGADAEKADIDGCSKAFWMGGRLSALQNGVYLTGSAGLGDDSADAKTSTQQLVETACSNA